MITAEKIPQPTTRALRQYLLLVCSYLALIFILPANGKAMQTYNLSSVQYHFLLLATIVPSLLIWLTAFVGYSKLRQYAESISKTPEGVHFAELARGCTWLAWSLPVTAIIPFTLIALSNHWHHLYPTAIIVSNYLNLFLPLIAFSIIAGAARGLMSSSGQTRLAPPNARLIIVSFLIAGVSYCYLTFRQLDLSSLASTHNPYFLPIWLMIVTITVPYLYAWFIGSLAAYELSLFTKQVKGVLYQRALRFVIGGLVAVILSSIAMQYINSVMPRAGYLVIDHRLVLSSLFRVIGGVGFILLAIGAIRLKKIEEI